MAKTSTLSGFPDATNTGLPDGVILTPSGDLIINTDGVTISGLDIKGVVTINADNVTLENCRITAANYVVVDVKGSASGAVIQDCEINGVGSGNEGSHGIQGSGTFLRNDIYNVENGINVTGGPTLIQDNYIHDLKASGSPHYDGIQIDGGVSNVDIVHNTIINDHGQTAAIMIDNYFGPISDINVDNNHLAGGGYTVYSDGQFGGGSISDVTFTNNHMEKGEWGYFAINNNDPVQTGNVDASSGALLGDPAPAGETTHDTSTDVADDHTSSTGTDNSDGSSHDAAGSGGTTNDHATNGSGSGQTHTPDTSGETHTPDTSGGTQNAGGTPDTGTSSGSGSGQTSSPGTSSGAHTSGGVADTGTDSGDTGTSGGSGHSGWWGGGWSGGGRDWHFGGRGDRGNDRGNDRASNTDHTDNASSAAEVADAGTSSGSGSGGKAGRGDSGNSWSWKSKEAKSTSDDHSHSNWGASHDNADWTNDHWNGGHHSDFFVI